MLQLVFGVREKEHWAESEIFGVQKPLESCRTRCFWRKNGGNESPQPRTHRSVDIDTRSSILCSAPALSKQRGKSALFTKRKLLW